MKKSTFLTYCTYSWKDIQIWRCSHLLFSSLGFGPGKKTKTKNNNKKNTFSIL